MYNTRLVPLSINSAGFLVLLFSNIYSNNLSGYIPEDSRREFLSIPRQCLYCVPDAMSWRVRWSIPCLKVVVESSTVAWSPCQAIAALALVSCTLQVISVCTSEKTHKRSKTSSRIPSERSKNCTPLRSRYGWSRVDLHVHRSTLF